MKSYAIAYVATAAAFFALDAMWLSFTARVLYRPLLGNMLLDSFNLFPAATFYLLYVIGIVIFAISPALASGRTTTALIYGSLFGFFAYVTYDLSNQATLRNWSSIVTVVDIGWGTLLTGLAATLGYLITSAFQPLVAQ